MTCDLTCQYFASVKVTCDLTCFNECTWLELTCKTWLIWLETKLFSTSHHISLTFIRQHVYYLGFYMNLASDLEYEGQRLDRKSANENWRHLFSISKRQKLNIASTRVQVLPFINFERLELDLKNKSINCDLTWIIFDDLLLDFFVSLAFC